MKKPKERRELFAAKTQAECEDWDDFDASRMEAVHDQVTGIWSVYKRAKRVANAKDWERRHKVEELIARGLNGECQAARGRLASMDAKIDFTGEIPEDAKDLFHGVKVTKGGIARPVATFDGGGPGVSSFVKWAIASRLGVDGIWRDAGDNRVTLLLEVTADSVEGLAGVAQHIATSFGALWKEFTRLPGATTNDARLFMRGLYDGMMADERKDGERLPSRTPARPKRARGKRNIVEAPALRIHPYSTAIEFGRRIRLTAPVDALCHELRELEQKSRTA